MNKMDILEIILSSAILISLWTVALLAKKFLPFYFSEKGRNLATKEDIQEITAKIESVRLQYAGELESIKAILGSQQYIHQVRYQKEFEILSNLACKLVLLRDAARGLRPKLDFVNPNEKEDERRERRLKSYHEAARDLYIETETKRPFYPDEIYQILRTLDQEAWAEAIDYREDTGEGYDSDYWKRAGENAQKILRVAEQALQAIRGRAKRWETLRFEELSGDRSGLSA